MKKDNKTIAVTLRFWTNDLVVNKPISQEKPIACWDFGMAILEANKEKGIRGTNQPFSCPEDIMPIIKELFRKAGIVVVSENKRPRVLSHRRKNT